jgi:hypothetical protein
MVVKINDQHPARILQKATNNPATFDLLFFARIAITPKLMT